MGIYLVTFNNLTKTGDDKIVIVDARREREVETWAEQIGKAMELSIIEVKKMQVIKVKGDPR